MDSSRPRKSVTSRPGANEDSKPKQQKAKPILTAERSEFDPRRSDPGVPGDTEAYDRASVRPSNFVHGPSQQPRAEGSRLTSTPTSTPTTTQRPRLSDPLREFLAFPLEDYKACERYCTRNPAIWSQDEMELHSLAIICLRQEQPEYARRCAERFLMITIARKGSMTAIQANTYLKSLSSSDDAFQDSLDKLLSQLSLESTGTEPDASSSQPPSTSSNPSQPARRGSTVEHQTRSVLGTQNVRPRTGDKTDGESPAELRYKDSPSVLSPGLGLSDRPSTQRTQQGSQVTAIPHRPARTASQTQSSYTSRPRVADPEVEEGSEIDARADTVDDNITLNDQEKQEWGINPQTQGLGPNLDLISSNYEEKDKLDASYKLYTGKEAPAFFVKGRVFAMVWHENVGIPAKSGPTEMSTVLDKPFNRYTINKDGVTIFSHIRRFVIVKAKTTRRYCLAIPIYSYRGRGLTDKRMLMDEKQAHTIIYDSKSQPVRISGEVKLDKEPIAVVLEPGEELKPSSRLHFGKMQSIDWNVKVKNIGCITDSTHLRRLMTYFEREFRRGEDTETEGKGRGKSSR